MTQHSDQPKIVLVYGNGSSYPGAHTVKVLAYRGLLVEPKSGHSSGSENWSAQKSGAFRHASHADVQGRDASVPAYDPHQVHREFPDRWQAYIRANYRNLMHVQQVFGVSERTSRKWWNGETGANGGHVAMAVNEHPVAAPRMLFAAE